MIWRATKVIRFRFSPAAALIVTATAACSEPLGQVYMLNEDSHPHPVRPGKAAKIFVPAAPEPRRLDVKCTLSGAPTARVRIAYSGVEPIGWAKQHPVFSLTGGEINVDIEAIVMPATKDAHSFAFVNENPSKLLWHQCYNN